MRSTWEDPSPGGASFAGPTLTSVVKALLILNVALFVLMRLVLDGTGLASWLALTPEMWRAFAPWFPLWQLLTYGFLHLDPMHLLGNMLFLYFFGTMLEGEIGPRRFLVFYLLAVVLAGLFQLALGCALGQMGPILGASGGVLAAVCATATLWPRQRVLFIFIPITLKTLALVSVSLDVFRVLLELKGEATGVASFAHLSGALFGYAAAKSGWIWRDPLAEVEDWRERRAEEREASDEERLDEILAKINRDGLHTLSSGERAFLKRASGRR